MPNIFLYFINFNDSFYLPFIKKHYAFCSRIIMYDNHSTDDSVKIATRLGFDVRKFGTPGQLNDQHYLEVKNNCWKEDRKFADYVIVCDADEFIWGDISKLTSSLPTIEGFNMVSRDLPVNDITELKMGHSSAPYSKAIIFDPKRIKDINYVHGCHECNPQGEITRDDRLKLLHYRMIGGLPRLLERHHEYRQRLSKFNLQHNMGHHYLHSDEQKKLEWAWSESQCTKII